MRTWATYWLNYKADRERRLVPIDSWHFPRNRRTECERLRHGGRLVLFVPGLSVDQEPAHHGHVVQVLRVASTGENNGAIYSAADFPWVARGEATLWCEAGVNCDEWLRPSIGRAAESPDNNLALHAQSNYYELGEEATAAILRAMIKCL